MAKVFIYTDETSAKEYGGEIFDEYLASAFEDAVFIISEDSKNLLVCEDGLTFITQEAF